MKLQDFIDEQARLKILETRKKVSAKCSESKCLISKRIDEFESIDRSSTILEKVKAYLAQNQSNWKATI